MNRGSRHVGPMQERSPRSVKAARASGVWLWNTVVTILGPPIGSGAIPKPPGSARRYIRGHAKYFPRSRIPAAVIASLLGALPFGACSDWIMSGGEQS